MHVMFMTRGHYDWLQYFIDELRTRYFPTKFYNPNTKKLQELQFKARLCPIQLWDYVFPEEHLDPVLNTIFQGTDGKGVRANLHLQKYLTPLRYSLGLKKIPDYNKDKQLVMQLPQHTEVIGLGIKEDKWITEDGKFVDKKDKTDLSYEGL